jgi:hypothetical protein
MKNIRKIKWWTVLFINAKNTMSNDYISIFIIVFYVQAQSDGVKTANDDYATFCQGFLCFLLNYLQ